MKRCLPVILLIALFGVQQVFANTAPAKVSRVKAIESIIMNSSLYFGEKKDYKLKNKFYPRLAKSLRGAIDREIQKAYKSKDGKGSTGFCKAAPSVVKNAARNEMYKIAEGGDDAARFVANLDSMFFALGHDMKMDNPNAGGIPMDFASFLGASSVNDGARSVMYLTDMAMSKGVKAGEFPMKSLLEDFERCKGAGDRVEPTGYMLESCFDRCKNDPFWSVYGGCEQ